MNLVRFISAVLVSDIILMALCTNMNMAGPGTGSDTPNSLHGSLYNQDGTVAQGVLVRLFPQNYNVVGDSAPPASLRVTTNNAGEYRFGSVPFGTYTMQAKNAVAGTCAFLGNIVVTENMGNIAPETLQIPGAIKVFLPDSINSAQGYVYLPGTDRAAFLAGNAVFAIIDSVPAGTIPSVYYAERNTLVRQVLREKVPVVAGVTATIRNPGWIFSWPLYLNTTASGAGVMNDVMNFPVLVRLTNSNFSFAQAKIGGEDIRFTKPDGTALVCEIERWDSAGGGAEIWVKVDTVRGNNGSQNIVMYWGNASAGAVSYSAAVFDTANGFTGVWHFDGPDTFVDATLNHNDLSDFHSRNSTDGAIGNARSFDTTDLDGVDSMRATGLCGMYPRFSISSWIKPHLADSGSGTIISLGDITSISISNTYINGFYHYTSGPSGWRNTSFVVNVLNNGWHYMTYTNDPGAGRQVMYLDGVQVSSTAYTDSVLWSGLGINTLIGTHGNGISYGDYDGLIDEIRFEKAIRSEDWVRLNYMNQKTPDALVEFK